MGYIGDFDIDIEVKPGCLTAMEAALNQKFRPQQPPCSLEQIVRSFWGGDVTVEYEAQPALMQLAGAANDTDTRRVYIQGETQCKWRDYHDTFLQVCAPYVGHGSYIQIRGEEHELVQQYVKDGEALARHAVQVWDDEYDELKRCKGHVEFANSVLRSYYDDGYEDAETALTDIRQSINGRNLSDLTP